jgi:hypothetical protein
MVVYGKNRSEDYEGLGGGISISLDGKTWAYQATIKGSRARVIWPRNP